MGVQLFEASHAMSIYFLHKAMNMKFLLESPQAIDMYLLVVDLPLAIEHEGELSLLISEAALGELKWAYEE